MLRAVLFDLDGTLIDTPGVIVETAQAVLRSLGRGEADPARVRATIGLPLQEAFADLLGAEASSALAQEAVARYRERWRAEVSPRVHTLRFPGALEGLQALRARGLKLAVVTGKTQAGADGTVEAAGLRPLFDFVGGYDAAPRPKPHADLALLALERLAIAPGEAVLVGDALLDLGMARAAGVRSIAVTWGAQPEETLRAERPDWVARSVPELFRILAAIA